MWLNEELQEEREQSFQVSSRGWGLERDNSKCKGLEPSEPGIFKQNGPGNGNKKEF